MELTFRRALPETTVGLQLSLDIARIKLGVIIQE
jgi:hypothetical protein